MEHDITIERGTGEPAETDRAEAVPELHAAGLMNPGARAGTAEIAAALGEIEPQPIEQIARAVDRLGADRARAFLARTQEIEAAGGVMAPHNSRRRTPSSVFFHLVRTYPALSREDRTYIFPPQFRRNGRKKTAGNTASVTPTPTSTSVPTGAATSAPIPSTVNRLNDHNLSHHSSSWGRDFCYRHCPKFPRFFLAAVA